jgi:hypothetical protein
MSKAGKYIGKHILVGLTYTDARGKVVRQCQMHGTITRVNARGIFFERADGEGEYSLPPDVNALVVAERGEYRLRATGEVVLNPDYVSTWTIQAPAQKQDSSDDEE